jgi:hypothetical protein
LVSFFILLDCCACGKTLIDWNEALTFDAQVRGIEVVTLLVSISIKHVLDVPNRVKSVALYSLPKKKRTIKGYGSAAIRKRNN